MSPRRVGPFLLGLVLVSAPGVLGCSSSPSKMGVPLRSSTRFESEFRSYRRAQPHRALAIAGDRERVFVTGVAFGQASQELANEGAMALCEQRRRDRSIEAPCQLYAEGDEVVEP